MSQDGMFAGAQTLTSLGNVLQGVAERLQDSFASVVDDLQQESRCAGAAD